MEFPAYLILARAWESQLTLQSDMGKVPSIPELLLPFSFIFLWQKCVGHRSKTLPSGQAEFSCRCQV